MNPNDEKTQWNTLKKEKMRGLLHKKAATHPFLPF